MPTDAEIFAGSNKDLILDNIIQVAKRCRNVDIARRFNAGRTKDGIHPMTVGARISRGLDFVAERGGRDRTELKEELEAERRRNGVAGRNQHTVAANYKEEEVVAEVEEDEEAEGASDASPAPAVQKVTPRKVKKIKKNHDGGDDAGTPSTVEVKQKPKRPIPTAPKYTLDEMEDSDATEDDVARSPEASEGKRAKKATPQMASGHHGQRRDSKAMSTTSASPLLKKSKRKTSSAKPAPSAAGQKRERDEEVEAGEADSQRDSRPQKAAKTTFASSTSSSTSPKSSKTAGRRASSSQGAKGLGAAGHDSPSSNSSSDLGERSPTPSPPTKAQVSDEEENEAGRPQPRDRVHDFIQELDDAETDALLPDYSPLNDDFIISIAGRLTVPEIMQSANRGAGRQRYSAAHVTRRLNRALERMAERRDTIVRHQYGELNRKRSENGIEAGGLTKRT